MERFRKHFPEPIINKDTDLDKSNRVIEKINKNFVSLVLRQFFIETGKTKNVELLEKLSFENQDKKIIGYALDFDIKKNDISKNESHIQLRSYAISPEDIKFAVIDGSEEVTESLAINFDLINNCKIVKVKPLIKEIVDNWKDYHFKLSNPNK